MRVLLGVAAILLFACGDNNKPKGPQDAGPDAPQFSCGNGVVDGNEQCDDGDANGGPNSRCTTQCIWTCLDDSWCTDMEPCNGAETCVDHACVAGTAETDGTSCGTGKVCRNGACTDGVCGDGFVTAPEECDDGNSANGDGCETSCAFSCVSTDTTRNCTPSDVCAGQGTCNDTTHICAAGTPLPNNTACGTGYCKNGTCTQPSCGNGVVEPGEQCDLGTSNGTMGSGCKANCTFECVTPATDCPTAPACQKEVCDTSHACAAVADTTKNGMSCGTNLVCNNGACTAPSAVCGNGVKETGEQCDFGAGNGANTGCETNCQFSCTIIPDSCNDGNACNGTETCTMVTVNNMAGQKCNATAAPAPGTSCGTGKICLGQLCVTSTCGDGFVDTGAGEQCEPPNTATCSATCKNIVCGDGVRAGTEQCDDGNTTNLDGCDGTCKFEQCHRANSLVMQFTPDSFCTKDALGAAIVGGTAQGQINTSLSNGVTDGSITIELAAYGLDDLTGTSDPQLSLGILTGSPVTGATTYNGKSDLDWWYTTAATVINAMRVATSQVTAHISAKVLTTDPAEVVIMITLAGVPATLDMLNTKIIGNVGTASKPTISANGGTPGHLPAEHLDSNLTSFATVSGGKLCGDVTAQSLANVPVPMALQSGQLTACSQGYTASNSLLDVLIGGCTVFFTTQIKSMSQPDGSRTGTDTFTFSASASTKQVNGCKKNNVTATLTDCLRDATYSGFFTFTSDRTIAK